MELLIQLIWSVFRICSEVQISLAITGNVDNVLTSLNVVRDSEVSVGTTDKIDRGSLIAAREASTAKHQMLLDKVAHHATANGETPGLRDLEWIRIENLDVNERVDQIVAKEPRVRPEVLSIETMNEGVVIRDRDEVSAK